ncbi:SDR family NAD(P)-dependent oxidoreductase, partial [Salmonella sp. zj-f60]|uniref:SDR family NAD(P)-dependent oxidoreductase n=1 Tax=Salmonella sp. zj-f60 TaxID=2582618 RepID=UPI00137273DF
RRLTTALLPGMRQRRWGRIINISGTMEPRGLNAAVAAKAALHLWAKGLACDVAAEGVTVNTIQPGRINSEQILEKLHPTEESRRAFIAK